MKCCGVKRYSWVSCRKTHCHCLPGTEQEGRDGPSSSQTTDRWPCSSEELTERADPEGAALTGLGPHQKSGRNIHYTCLLGVCMFMYSMYMCVCICNCTLWWFSMIISTTMFWNLMFIMAATVSSCDLISVGPKIIPRLDTVIRFWSLWEDTLCTQEN